MYNGILIGYQVGWSSVTILSHDSGKMDVGLEAESLNITDLKIYRTYSVYVAGRTNGGVGVENYKEVMTDEDGEELSNVVLFTF